MNKPTKPTKKILVKNYANYDFDWVSKKVSLQGFISWCKEKVPPDAEDVTLELMEDWNYDSSLTYLQIAWIESHPNKAYAKQLKSYEKALAKYKAQ